MDFERMTNMSHGELKRLHDTAKRNSEEKYKANSKKRLINNLTRKFQTTMIGALARFEEVFGYLWGYGKQHEDRTKEEKEWFDKWQEVRTAILNNGNNQLRASLDEVSQYTMTWDRHQTQFIIRKDY